MQTNTQEEATAHTSAVAVDKKDISRASTADPMKKMKEARSKSRREKRPSSLRRHRRHKEENLAKFNYDMPGVSRIVLSEKTQQYIGMVVGEDVSSESPWKLIKKETIVDHMELTEDSEFLAIRLEMLPYPRPDVLMGYIPDEIREYDEFYMVLSEKAEDVISDVIQRIKKKQEAKLSRALSIESKGVWKTYGSEAEIAEYTEQANRALYEVEVETAYPIMSPKVQFRVRHVQDARDGYVELLQTRNPMNPIFRNRIDTAVQVTPQVVAKEAQTICTYPKNAWTQYHYEYDPVLTLSEDFHKHMKQFIQTNLDDICDKIRVNDHINLYTNDYLDLITDQSYTESPENLDWEEYMSFADLNDARNKMITSASWHPMLTGTVAIAYADRAPNTFLRGKSTLDEVNNIVHGKHPILIWCFNDSLYPKLQLECPRPIDCISFCPHDPNILVGAMSNGQVVVWDIKNRLEKVEEEEILTEAQQKYRVLMFSLMNWFKNIKNIRYVRVTAQSDQSASHSRNVTRINWLNPFRKIVKTGQILNIPENEHTTMTFCTSSIDGTLLFWDMLTKPSTHGGGDYKPQRRLRRLKVRPSALTIDVSQFRFLNRLWRPRYRITVINQKKHRALPIASSDVLAQLLRYEKVDPKEPDTLLERVAYKPIMERPTVPHSSKVLCGTSNGYVYTAHWEGYEVDPGEECNSESARIISIGRYHDGPVHTLDRNSYAKTTFLSIGGRIFAIWRDDFLDRPIMWRKSRVRYLHGHWAKGNPSMFRLSRRDGSREVWSLLKRTDKKMYEQNISGERVLGSYVHQRPLPIGVIGIADNNGAFRMFYIPNLNLDEIAGKQLTIMLDREVVRKKAFREWQTNWLEANKEKVEQQMEYRKRKMDAMLEKERKQQQQEAEEKAAQEKAAKLAEKKTVPQPGHYREWAQEQWKIKEEERMKRVLLVKKQLNPNLLVSQQMPLKLLEKEEEKKKKRQKERLAESEKLFDEAVATLFPDVIKTKPPPPVNPYKGGYSTKETSDCFDKFQNLCELASDFIEDNPFKYNFNWKTVVHEGMERRREIHDEYVIVSHKERLQSEKRMTLGEEAVSGSKIEISKNKIFSEPSVSFASKSANKSGSGENVSMADLEEE